MTTRLIRLLIIVFSLVIRGGAVHAFPYNALIIGGSVASYFAYKACHRLPFFNSDTTESQSMEQATDDYNALIPGIHRQLALLTPKQRIQHNIATVQKEMISSNAIQRILNGGALVHNIRNGFPYIHANTSQQQQLEDFVDIAYYFSSEALNKGQLPGEGSFVIHDQDFRIYNFFMNYAQRCNPNITNTLQDPAHFKADNPFAYSRISTHKRKAQKKFRQYGIDIRFSANGPLQQLLPNHKAHILFGKIDEKKELLFFKLERYGLSFGWEFVGHTYELLREESKKIARHTPFVHRLFPEEHPLLRCERIPRSFKRRCKSIFYQAKNLIQSCNEELMKKCTKAQNKCLKHGIHCLYELGQQPDMPHELAISINNYIAELENQYDYLAFRSGREVIIGEKEFAHAKHYHQFLSNSPL